MSLNLNNFDPVIYKLLNNDLKYLNINELDNHFNKIGINENRLYKFNVPKKFSYHDYKNLIKDLEKYNELECYKHYTLYGRKEDRKYFDYDKESLKFDYKIYRELNVDLNTFDKNKLLTHFKNYGKNENRKITRLYFRKIYYICNIAGGGTAKYLEDLKNLFNKILFIKILDKEELYEINFEKNDILIIVHLINTNINCNDLIDIYNKINLNILITIHDCFWINYKNNLDLLTEEDIHGSYLYKNTKYNIEVSNLFDIIKIIIFPTKFIKNAYSNFYKINNSIIIPHNDILCKIGKLNININNNIIKIGICHGYSIYKGKELYEILLDKYYNKKYKGYIIKFVIVGITCENYNEDNFIEFLNNNNINGLSLLNKWGESYCYTLTKFINSGLPIIYNNFGSFQDRMPTDSRYIDVFGYEEHFNQAINNNKSYLNYFFDKFDNYLDFIIKNNNYKSIENKINNKIITNNFYKDLFFTDTINKNIVIITSKIIVSEQNFSYCKNRSVYSKEERFSQTLETIKSIKNNIKNYFIILFDNSYFFDKNKLVKLKESVDLFINNSDDSDLNIYTNFYEYKSFGEMSQLLRVYELYLKYINFDAIKSLYKISGRYIINNNFDYSIFNNSSNIIKKNNDLKDIDYYYTCFYKIDKNNINSFYENIKKAFLNKNKYYKLNLEEMIPEFLDNKFKLVDNLGITQRIAVWNKNIEYI